MRQTTLTIFFVFILSLLFFWMRSTYTQSNFNKLLTQNYELLLPADTEATVPQITTKEWSRTSEWTIDTGQSWKEYRTWLGKQIGGTYRILSEAEGQVDLRKTYHSEIHDIKLTAYEERGKIHVVFRLSLW